MKIKIVVPVITITIIISLLFLYMFTHVNMWNNGLAAPNRITFNINGKQNQFNIGDKNNQSIIKKVNQLIVFDMPDAFGLDSPVAKSDVKEIEEFSVEYVYNTPQRKPVNNPNIEQVQFIKMVFPLDKKWENQVYIKTKDDLYYFVGYRSDLGLLVRSTVY